MKVKKLGSVTLSYDVLSDGSGMPSVAKCLGMTFAIDYLGSVKLTNITQGNYSKKNLAMALQYVKVTYLEVLFEETDDLWLELNRAMYS